MLTKLKSIEQSDVHTKLDQIYSTKCKKEEINVNDKCVKYGSKEAQKTMLELLNMKSKSIDPNFVIGPRQILSNCWLNSFFMCYFISDKGRKFFRNFRRMMITGEKVKGGKKISPKYKTGLWLLNKTIQASLGWSMNSEKFIINADTNDILRLLRKGDSKKIVDVNKPWNPLTFYKTLFDILGLTEGVKYVKIYLKDDFENIVKNKKIYTDVKNTELIIFERRDDVINKDISSKKNIPPKQFIYAGNKYVLDSTVLRDTKKKHFTSYVTINGKEYAFEGGAHRRLRLFNWKDKLTKGENKTWKFGSPYDPNNIMKRQIGWELDEVFNFSEGYQLNFYYRV